MRLFRSTDGQKREANINVKLNWRKILKLSFTIKLTGLFYFLRIFISTLSNIGMNSLAQYRVYNAVNYFSGDERLQLGATLNQFSIFVQLLFTKCRVFARVQIVRVSPYLYVFKNKYLGKGKDNFFSSLKHLQTWDHRLPQPMRYYLSVREAPRSRLSCQRFSCYSVAFLLKQGRTCLGRGNCRTAKWLTTNVLVFLKTMTQLLKKYEKIHKHSEMKF